MPPTPGAFLDRFPNDGPRTRLAFLYQSDAPAEYTRTNGRQGDTVFASLLGFELLSAHWFRKVWHRYLSGFGHGNLLKELEWELGPRGRLQDGFDRLSEHLRQKLYDAHLRYGMRMRLESDPAPVGLAELVADVNRLATDNVREGDWYVVHYHGGHDLRAPRQPTRPDEMVYASIGLSSNQDGPPRRATVLDIVPLAMEFPGFNLLLQALHFPQTDPQANGRGGGQARRPDGGAPHIVVDESQHFRVKGTYGDFPLTFARRRDQPAETVSGLAALKHVQAPGGPATAAALPAPATHAAAAPAQPHAQGNPMAYTGSGPRPFVGVNAVGAGNNAALYGRDGIVAHVDFGAPLTVNANTDPGGTTPCLCGDSPMILSH